MVETLSSTALIGVRDRTMLLVGFAGAFRCSELVSLDVADVTFGDDGLIVQLRRSRTDQEGQGRKIGPRFGSTSCTCPVRTLRAWLDVAAIAHGPIFRPVDRHANVGPLGRDLENGPCLDPADRLQDAIGAVPARKAQTAHEARGRVRWPRPGERPSRSASPAGKYTRLQSHSVMSYWKQIEPCRAMLIELPSTGLEQRDLT